MSETGPPTARAAPVPPALERAAAYAWRILVVAAVVVGLLYVAGLTLVVVVPVIVGFLVTRALWPVHDRLRRMGLRPALSAAITLFGFLIAVTAVLVTVGVAFAGEVDQLGPTLEDGVQDIEDWLVEDSPWDISRDEIESWKEQAADATRDLIRDGSDTVVSGARIAGEVVVGLLLALVITFFFLKDGEDFRRRAVGLATPDRRAPTGRAMTRAWEAAGGYLRGAALLGVVEGTTIGITLAVVGASLALPVAVITFISAFVPIVGAVAAGIVAVLVALATAGTGAALIVLVVALLVQQFDNDLLAPVIYGKSLALHPLVILLGITAGSALFGVVGTFLAVPILAMSINAARGYRAHPDAAALEPEPVGGLDTTG